MRRSYAPIAAALVALTVGALSAGQTQAQQAPPAKSETAQLIEKALASSIRTTEERARDNPERKPVETLEFFGLEPDMTVVEMFPGGGWYTKILAPVLADKGKLILLGGAERLAPKLKEWQLDKVQIPPAKFTYKPTGQFGVFAIESIDPQVTGADMVLTFRNAHNFSRDSQAKLHRAAFAMLKPGGVYGVVDHTRRHNEPDSKENWRRMDPVLAIYEITAAGFVFEGYSDLHYRPDDELRYDTQRPSIGGYSDRFTLKFRKPAAR
jgi:predicted methyltransferase